MSEAPETPYFFFDSESASFYLEESEPKETIACNQLFLINQANSKEKSAYFDKAGHVWNLSVKEGVRSDLLAKIIAQVYNPKRTVSGSWSLVRTYELDELRKAYLYALELDDDILTQFVGPDDLAKRIENSKTFQDLVDTWQWAQVLADVDP